MSPLAALRWGRDGGVLTPAAGAAELFCRERGRETVFGVVGAEGSEWGKLLSRAVQSSACVRITDMLSCWLLLRHRDAVCSKFPRRYI